MSIGSQAYCGRWDRCRAATSGTPATASSWRTDSAVRRASGGDGERTGSEQCDDGNTQNGDCCIAGLHASRAAGACSSDGNQCTSDTCDASGVCRHQPATGASCDDGNGCTTGDVCVAGTCRGEPLRAVDQRDRLRYARQRHRRVRRACGTGGKDLSGYHVVSVEGAVRCLTERRRGTGVLGRDAAFRHRAAMTTPAPGSIPRRRASRGRPPAGACDLTLAGDASTSNPKDGDALNSTRPAVRTAWL